jgi:hypothetical protein
MCEISWQTAREESTIACEQVPSTAAREELQQEGQEFRRRLATFATTSPNAGGSHVSRCLRQAARRGDDATTATQPGEISTALLLAATPADGRRWRK